MMFELGGKWHRYLALGLLLYVVYMLYLGLVNPAIEARSEAKQRYEALLQQLNSYRKKSALLGQAQEKNKLLTERINTDRRFLKADNIENAQRNFQQKILELVRASGASIGRVIPVNGSQEGDSHIVRIQAQLTLDHQSLLNLLYQFENGEPRIFIDALKIDSNNVSRVQKQQTEPVSLNATLTLTAIWFEQ